MVSSRDLADTLRSVITDMAYLSENLKLLIAKAADGVSDLEPIMSDIDEGRALVSIDLNILDEIFGDNCEAECMQLDLLHKKLGIVGYG